MYYLEATRPVEAHAAELLLPLPQNESHYIVYYLWSCRDALCIDCDEHSSWSCSHSSPSQLITAYATSSTAVLLISVTLSHLNNVNTNSRLQHSDWSEYYALHIDATIATQVLLQWHMSLSTSGVTGIRENHEINYTSKFSMLTVESTLRNLEIYALKACCFSRDTVICLRRFALVYWVNWCILQAYLWITVSII